MAHVSNWFSQTEQKERDDHHKIFRRPEACFMQRKRWSQERPSSSSSWSSIFPDAYDDILMVSRSYPSGLKCKNFELPTELDSVPFSKKSHGSFVREKDKSVWKTWWWCASGCMRHTSITEGMMRCSFVCPRKCNKHETCYDGDCRCCIWLTWATSSCKSDAAWTQSAPRNRHSRVGQCQQPSLCWNSSQGKGGGGCLESLTTRDEPKTRVSIKFWRGAHFN